MCGKERRDPNNLTPIIFKKNIVPNVLDIFQLLRNKDDVSFSHNRYESSHSENSNNSDSNYGTNILPAVDTFRRENGKVGRNDLCPCGSGKKYKKCCLH